MSEHADSDPVRRRIERAAGARVLSLQPLAGGCIAEVYRVSFEHRPDAVAKVDNTPDPTLDIEGDMLSELARTHAPIPRVIAAQRDVLLIEHIENDGQKSAEGEQELASVLAALHTHRSDSYGLDRDTLIGPLDQPNRWTESWPRFYAEQRVRPMADLAEGQRALPHGCHERLIDICDRMEQLIGVPNPPALIHGDLWAGNILWHRGHLAAIIDPAIYYADPEIELAFIDLMGGVGDAFWASYTKARPIAAEFWRHRNRLYQLYPLLVHAALFGGGYGSSVDRIAREL